jgi:hypothetical protein
VFEQVAGGKLNIAWGKRGYRKREMMEPWSKGARIPGWIAKVTLEEGIEAFLRARDEGQEAVRVISGT